jgi:autoinducer 2-degrading protein
MIKVVAKPGCKEELMEFLRWDAAVVRADEPGTLRFDAWHVPDEPDAVYLYEAYADEAAFKAHQGSAPFKKFVEHIIPNVIEPIVFILPFDESAVSAADHS